MPERSERSRPDPEVWHAANRPPKHGPGTVDDPSSVPPPTGTRAWYDQVDWRAWFRNLGRQTRTLRELLALSQQRLARLANLSQGAISRFEKGTALGTPGLVMLKVGVALARQCRAEHQEILAEPLIQLIEDIEKLVPVRPDRDLPMMARDRDAADLLLLFRAAPPRVREAILLVARTLSTTQANDPS